MSKKKKGKAKRILVYLFLICLMGLFTIIYILPLVTGAFVKTSLIEYGSLKVIDQVTCYFVRDEQVHKAGGPGSIQYFIDEGEVVRKGSKVLELVPSGESYRASGNYMISYYTDGCEDLFTPANMDKLTKEEIESLEIEVHDIYRESAIAGEPLFKTVDHSLWYVVFWVEPQNIVKYNKGSTVYLNLPLGEVKGTTYDIIDDNGQWMVVLKFTRHYDDLAKLRKIEAEVVTSDYEGLIIANESITTQDGKPGVYVKDISGEYIFTPVSVIASDGVYSLVESSHYYEKSDGKNIKVSTVDVYDEILNHPKGNSHEY